MYYNFFIYDGLSHIIFYKEYIKKAESGFFKQIGAANSEVTKLLTNAQR